MNSLLAILALVAVAAGSALRPNDASLVATIEGLQDNPLRPPVHTLDEVIAALVATNNWALLDLITNELQAANAGPSATIDTSIVPQKPSAAVTLPLLPVEELSPVTLPLFPIEGPVAVERPLPESASAVSVVDRPLPVAAPAAAPESAPATSPLVTIILNIQKASDVSADSPGTTFDSVIRPIPVASAPVAVTLPFPIAVENPSPVASAPAAVTLPFPIAVEDLSPVAPLPIQVAANDPLWRKFHGTHGNERVVNQSHGFWIVDLDANSPHSVSPYVPEVREAVTVSSEDCYNHLYCGMPYLLPVQHFIWKTHFVATRTPPNLPLYARVDLIERETINGATERFHLNVSGPGHIGLMLSPVAGARILKVSAIKEIGSEAISPVAGPLWRKNRETYFIYLAASSRSSEPWLLQFDVEHSFPLDEHPKHWLDVSVAGHFLHGPHKMDSVASKFVDKFPPWTAVSLWSASFDSYVI